MLKVYSKQTWLDHLRQDIMPFWTSPGMLGTPLGNFPTFANQNGCPIPDQEHYMRTLGRQIYTYLTAAELLDCPEYLKYAQAGFEWLENHARNPKGGYFTRLTEDGRPVNCPITVQDLCYTVFPYLHLYRRTEKADDLQPVLEVIRLIDKKFQCGGKMIDAMDPNYTRRDEFEGDSLNIVSVLDLMNLLVVPLAQMRESIETSFPEGMELLERLLDLLVEEFWHDGIFWNNAENRSDYAAKHVDFGHTSKAYGIVLDANRILAKSGRPVKYRHLERHYIPMLQASADSEIGWKTDFASSSCTFRKGAVQWWRYILIDQVAARYAADYAEVRPLLRNGLEHWFSLPFVDKGRAVRGIREGLREDGTLWGDDTSFTCKANLWKNGYHEVEHVQSMLQYLQNFTESGL